MNGFVMGLTESQKEAMEAEFLEKLRSIRQGGKTKGKARVRKLSEGGKVHAVEVDYADGRVEAIVRPGAINAKLSITGRDDG